MRAGEDITEPTHSPTAAENEVSAATVTPHTPTPWVIERPWHPACEDCDTEGAVVDGLVEQICVTSPLSRPTERLVVATIHHQHLATEANARLIAAAPDLLAALKVAREVIETLGHAGHDHRGVEGCNHCGFPWDGEHDPDGCCVPPALKGIDAAIASASPVAPSGPKP